METEKEITRACATCRYCETKFAPPPSIERVRVCKRFPPVPVPMPGQGGGISFMAFWPAVGEADWCHEWTAEQAANKILDG